MASSQLAKNSSPSIAALELKIFNKLRPRPPNETHIAVANVSKATGSDINLLAKRNLFG